MRKLILITLIIFAVVSMVNTADIWAHRFSEEVEKILSDKINLIKKELMHDPIIIKAAHEANERNKAIALSDIMVLDDKWKATEGVDDFIKGFIKNECAKRLLEFQEVYNEFYEIFVADEKGLVVGATNKTSDYYQADEDWWVKGYNEGKGKTFHGDIEYDDSSLTDAIALYVPIMDLDQGKAIGVIKAVFDISMLQLDLL